MDQAASDPAAPSIRMVNSKRVTLNFELKDVGASGVSGVELWCTQDAHTWKKGEIEAQTNHSFTVEVKEEGLYGFTLLARNGSGVGKEDAPAPGEQPQVWVMVDVTKPTVQISSVEITHAGKEPTVEIHWTAKDKNLGPQADHAVLRRAAGGAVDADRGGRGEQRPVRVAAAGRGAAPAVPAGRGRGHAGQRGVGADGQPAAPGHGRRPSSPRRRPTCRTRRCRPRPPLDTSRPTAAILAVEPGGN